jgi:hypothetical protein
LQGGRKLHDPLNLEGGNHRLGIIKKVVWLRNKIAAHVGPLSDCLGDRLLVHDEHHTHYITAEIEAQLAGDERLEALGASDDDGDL